MRLPLEHAISRRGYVRSWTKLCYLLAVLIAVPAFTVLPLLLVFMTTLAAVCYAIFQTVLYLLLALLCAIVIFLILGTVATIARSKRS
jgi:hypothetical protein